MGKKECPASKRQRISLCHKILFIWAATRGSCTYFGFFFKPIRTILSVSLPTQVILICNKLTLHPLHVLCDDSRTLKKSSSHWRVSLNETLEPSFFLSLSSPVHKVSRFFSATHSLTYYTLTIGPKLTME